MNIGDYVRTKKGYIGKIKNIYLEDGDMELGQIGYLYIETDNKYSDESECPDEEDIIKAKSNIIDLIEVGDYVNGYKVSFKGNDYKPFVQCDYPVEEGTTNHYRFYEETIKSIVTKEQFKSMEYRLGDK